MASIDLGEFLLAVSLAAVLRFTDEKPRAREPELPESLREVPHLAGSLFEPVFPDEHACDIPDEVMKPVL